ncbi:MAG: heavy metal-associated domain-containing protein [Bacillota bacterium]|nr:heavy metal-associated domain-containing protein [Bacillota bacterium]
MKTITFQVDGLTCPSCAQHIEKVMTGQKGVQETKVLYNAQKVKISFDETVGNSSEYEEILNKLGYDVKSQKIA